MQITDSAAAFSFNQMQRFCIFFYLLCATTILLLTNPDNIITGLQSNGHTELLLIQTAVELDGDFNSMGAVGYVMPLPLYLLPAAVSSRVLLPVAWLELGSPGLWVVPVWPAHTN